MFSLFRKPKSPPTDSEIVWSCDYCYFRYCRSVTHEPYLEIYGTRGNDLICSVGNGDELPDYETGSESEAIQSGLDVLDLYDVEIRYNDQTDEELGCSFGEYGSNKEWLASFRHS